MVAVSPGVCTENYWLSTSPGKPAKFSSIAKCMPKYDQIPEQIEVETDALLLEQAKAFICDLHATARNYGKIIHHADALAAGLAIGRCLQKSRDSNKPGQSEDANGSRPLFPGILLVLKSNNSKKPSPNFFLFFFRTKPIPSPPPLTEKPPNKCPMN